MRFQSDLNRFIAYCGNKLVLNVEKNVKCACITITKNINIFHYTIKNNIVQRVKFIGDLSVIYIINNIDTVETR